MGPASRQLYSVSYVRVHLHLLLLLIAYFYQSELLQSRAPNMSNHVPPTQINQSRDCFVT